MRPRILIVDDETNVRLNYRVTLETEIYEIVEAASAARALHQLIEQSFSLAILDMRLPGMDGLALLARMREIGVTVPVMIVTAYSDVPHAVRAMKLGAIDFLQKPLRPEDLRHIVAEILERHAPREEHQIKDFHSHIVAAKRCLNLRSFEYARLHLVQAMELNTKSVEAFNLAGVLAEMLDDVDKAKKYYGQAIKLNKNYEPAQQNMRRLFELQHFGSSSEPFNLGGT
jgi:two-component system OmpR family response regulator